MARHHPCNGCVSVNASFVVCAYTESSGVFTVDLPSYVTDPRIGMGAFIKASISGIASSRPIFVLVDSFTPGDPIGGTDGSLSFTLGGTFSGNIYPSSGSVDGMAATAAFHIVTGMSVSGTGLLADNTVVSASPSICEIAPGAVDNPSGAMPPGPINSSLDFSLPDSFPTSGSLLLFIASTSSRSGTMWEDVTSEFSLLKIEATTGGTYTYRQTSGGSYTNPSNPSLNTTTSNVSTATATVKPMDYNVTLVPNALPLPTGTLTGTYSTGATSPPASFLNVGTFYVLKCTDCCSNCFYILTYSLDPTTTPEVSSGGLTWMYSNITTQVTSSGTFLSGNTGNGQCSFSHVGNFIYEDQGLFCWNNPSDVDQTTATVELDWFGQQSTADATATNTDVFSGTVTNYTGDPAFGVTYTTPPFSRFWQLEPAPATGSSAAAFSEVASLNSCEFGGGGTWTHDFSAVPVNTTTTVPGSTTTDGSGNVTVVNDTVTTITATMDRTVTATLS